MLIAQYFVEFIFYSSAPKHLEQRLIEEKEQIEFKRNQIVRAYAEKLSLNQRRILLGIRKFTSKIELEHDESVNPIMHLTNALREKVRELRKK